MDILNVRVDNLEKKEIIAKIESFLYEDKFHQIATVNPEFILQAQNDAGFRDTLNEADLNVADGVGIRFAFWRFGEKLKARIAGADLMNEILKMANEKKLGVFLVANKKGLSAWKEARAAILKKYPNLKINGADLETRFPSGKRVSKLSDRDVVFCNFGVPEQEKFLHSLKRLENGRIKLAMGVGGSFDFMTGKIKRAPKFMKNLGLEWFWRFFQQSWDRKLWRLKRIWKAVVIFPIKVIFQKA